MIQRFVLRLLFPAVAIGGAAWIYSDPRSFQIGSSVFGVILLALFVGAGMAYYEQTVNEEWELLSEGEAVEGTVVFARTSRYGQGSSTLTYVEYEYFRNPGDPEPRNRKDSITLRGDQVLYYPPGGPILVLYHATENWTAKPYACFSCVELAPAAEL